MSSDDHTRANTDPPLAALEQYLGSTYAKIEFYPGSEDRQDERFNAFRGAMIFLMLHDNKLYKVVDGLCVRGRKREEVAEELGKGSLQTITTYKRQGLAIIWNYVQSLAHARVIDRIEFTEIVKDEDPPIESDFWNYNRRTGKFVRRERGRGRQQPTSGPRSSED